MKRKIFISYSHHDMEHAHAIHRQLTAYDIDETMIFLDRAKEGIAAGQEWEERIEDEIFEAGVALFLISPNFLNSRFIMTKEMPKILETHVSSSQRRVEVQWVKLSEITVPKELKPFQGFCNGSPLTTLGESDRQKAIDDIAKSLSSGYHVDATTREEIHGRIKSIARKKFGLRLGRPRARSINSSAYIGYGVGYVAHVKARYVKAIDHSSDVTNGMLQERLAVLHQLRHPAFVRVSDGAVEDNLQVLVSEHLPRSKTIRQQIKAARKEKRHLSIDRVRLALRTLAEALACYHESGLIYGNFTTRNILTVLRTENDWRVRLPSFRMSHFASLSRSRRNIFTFDPEKMTYLAPEQYYQMSATEKTDQYSLGLLVTEMLLGKLPVVVKTIEDLHRKKEYFADTKRLSRSLGRRSPQLRDVIMRMLSPDPDDRYETMRALVDGFETASSAMEDNRRLAKKSFVRVMQEKEVFFADFYNILFDERDDLKALFEAEFEQNGHFQKLERAILYMLNFNSDDGKFEPTILTEIRSSHGRFGLTPADFDHFNNSLLAALNNAGAKSPEIQEAWRLSVRPGLGYMKQGGALQSPDHGDVADSTST